MIDGSAARALAEARASRAATLWDAFVEAASAAPEAPFLIVPARPGRPYLPEGAQYTYAAALAEVEARRATLARAGYGPGHRVALLLENTPEHVFTQLALYALGASQVPVNPDYLDHELAFLLEHSEADLAIALPRAMPQLARVAGPLGVRLAEAGGAVPPAPPARRTGETGRHAEAAVIYTSGTTGRPKGCQIDQEYHFAVGRAYARVGGRLALKAGGDRLFVPLPVFHVNAGINTLSAVILTGNALILPDRFHPDSFWHDVVATGATAVHYLGIIPPLLLKRPPTPEERAHRLRFGLGAGLDPQIHRAFEERFGIPMVEVWGMTETGRFLADAHEPRRIDTRAFGKPSEDLDARVVDDAGKPVPPGTPGELVVRARGPDPRHGFFRGYLKDPKATEEAWRTGWFHTGDVVVQDADGMLYFVERRKNIIRRSGENISAAEVENALVGHPSVAAVAVIGVPDELRDEEVMACILPVAGTPRDAATARAILDFARSQLAYYKLPGWIVFVDDLPRTGTQKVRKGLIFPGLADPRQAPGAIDLRPFKKRETGV